jgi:hypothetical protein
MINVSPAEPKVFGPLQVDVHIDSSTLGSTVVDVWGAIFLAGGGVQYLVGPPPCSLSATAAPIAQGVTLPGGYNGTLVSVPSIPLGYEGTHRVVVGLIPTGVTPVSVPPYGFITRYWDEDPVTVSLP